MQGIRSRLGRRLAASIGTLSLACTIATPAVFAQEVSSVLPGSLHPAPSQENSEAPALMSSSGTTASSTDPGSDADSGTSNTNPGNDADPDQPLNASQNSNESDTPATDTLTTGTSDEPTTNEPGTADSGTEQPSLGNTSDANTNQPQDSELNTPDTDINQPQNPETDTPKPDSPDVSGSDPDAPSVPSTDTSQKDPQTPAGNNGLPPAGNDILTPEGSKPLTPESNAVTPESDAQALETIQPDSTDSVKDTQPVPLTTEEVANEYLPSEGRVFVRANGGRADQAWNVAFEVSGNAGTTWVQGLQDSRGIWYAYIPAAQIGQGDYTIAAHANIASDPSVVLGSTSGTVGQKKVQTSLTFDTTSGQLGITVRNAEHPRGVAAVSAGITSPSGITHWIGLSLQEDNTWFGSLAALEFCYEPGTYRVDLAYADASWAGINAGSSTCDVSYGEETVTTTASGGTIHAEASGTRAAAAWNVAFEIFNGKQTTWVQGIRQDDGSWICDTPATGFGEGTYTARALVAIGSFPVVSMGTASGTILGTEAHPSLCYNDALGTIDIVVKDVTCPTGVKAVSVGLTSPDGTNHWQGLALDDQGNWSGSFDAGLFNWQMGTYAIDIAIADNTWTGVSAGHFSDTITIDKESADATLSGDDSLVTMTVAGGRVNSAWNVAFEVASSNKTVWIQGVKQADGSWSATSPVTETGTGKLAITAILNVSDDTIRSAQTTLVVHPHTEMINTVVNNVSGSVRLELMGGDVEDAWNVAFAVYNDYEGPGMTSWYQAYRQEDGSWAADISADINGVGLNHVDAYMNVGDKQLQPASATYTYIVNPTITDTITLEGGDYDVSYGMAGLKVQRIQNALGIGNYNFPRYLDQTAAAVRNFQSRVGLPVTGVVDHQTWLALGLSEYDWMHLGAYVSPTELPIDATASQRVEAMINRAYQYLNDPYVWDAAGTPGQGIDCAGLVLQGMYAAGLDMGIINPVTHSTTAWGDHDAYNMYHFGGLSEVADGDLRRGDLVFYQSSGLVNHVGIYLGSDQVIEALPNKVKIGSLWRSSFAGIKRVFK